MLKNAAFPTQLRRALWLLSATVMAITPFGMHVAFAGSASQSGSKSGEGTIRACSHYGHGCVTAPVRNGSRGREVRLPGGTWIHCAGDCRETLIETTIDFWDKQRDGAPDTAG
jgi:hypothetical protein